MYGIIHVSRAGSLNKKFDTRRAEDLIDYITLATEEGKVDGVLNDKRRVGGREETSKTFVIFFFSLHIARYIETRPLWSSR